MKAKKEGVIGFVTYNTMNGLNGGPESDLRSMDQANIDLGVLQETKLT